MTRFCLSCADAAHALAHVVRRSRLAKVVGSFLTIFLFTQIFAFETQAQVVVTPGNLHGWTTSGPEADNRPGGGINFISDALAPSGAGALQLTTDATTAAKAQLMRAETVPLASVTQLSYYTRQTGATPPSGDPSFQLAVFLDGTAASFTNLVYEPYWNGAVLPGAWQSWDVYSGNFWSSRTVTLGACSVTAAPGGPPAYTLATIKANCPSAVVVAYGLNVGTFNPNYTVEADLFNFNGTISDFEAPVVVDIDGQASATDCNAFDPAQTTIQAGISAASAGGEVKVCPGTYHENVVVNKANLILTGSGPGSTIISAPTGATNAAVTIAASGVDIGNFGITRDGNSVATWNDALSNAGIAIQGLSITGTVIHDSNFFGNRTGLDINNSGGHTIRNNVIDNNRTGLVFRNQTDNITFVENQVTNNWTVGILFLDASGGTNAPLQQALNSHFNNNNFSGNWYGQIVDRQSGGSLPAPGTNPKNFSGNWFGSTSPVITTANTTEPGYAALIPVFYGGTSTPPGGQPDIAGPASANFQISPILNSGTDTNIETMPGRGTYGFQGSMASVTVVPATVPTAADNDYTRINNAVQAAVNGQMIVLNGTFNWTEPNAAASWALGSDGISQSGGGDDYCILPPANLSGVTITASSLGAATIQGPGDLPNANLEGVFEFFNDGDNQNWTISNLRFIDFDLAIGMFNGAGGTDAYNGTQILNNYILVARDVNDAAAPIDTNQNIGIHYSYGANQIISGNTIELHGDGVSASPSGPYSTEVGMQSNTSGGSVYNGLQITNNTVRVLNAQSATPEVAIGIWENGHAHTSNITVSGNQFINAGAGNNAALNLERGFRITSHSSATSTVAYSNNSVSGANIGFQWLAVSAGNQPVQLVSNTITNGATGVFVDANGTATLSYNRIAGNSVTGVNNTLGSAVTAENNWWGCNYGPGAGGAGCAGTANGVTGTVDANPWLTLTTAAVPTTVGVGGSSAITSKLTINSNSTDTSSSGFVPNGTPAAFAGVNGTVAPPSGVTTSGVTGTTFTATTGGAGNASTNVDAQTVSAAINVTISISGNISPSMSGVTVTLAGSQSAVTTTDGSGNYSFSGLAGGGSYLITPSLTGFTFEPTNRSYSNVTTDVTTANFNGFAGPSSRIVRVLNGYTTPGQNVTVPVELVSQGNENSVGFTINYDPTLVFNPVVTLGADAGSASLLVNSGTSGKVGAAIALPTGQAFATGTRQLATITFNTNPTSVSSTPLTFGNVPVILRVANANADPLPATFQGGSIVFAQGLEADVVTRFTGDNSLDLFDFQEVGRFAVGLDAVNPLFNEYQRADCAPRSTKGDGSLDITDFVQAGRYAVGLDTPTTAGGPLVQLIFPLATRERVPKEDNTGLVAAPRDVHVVGGSGFPGGHIDVSVDLTAQGDEAGVGFTLSYDPAILSNPVVTIGTGFPGATLIANTITDPGRVGVLVTYINQAVPAGERQVASIRFEVSPSAAPGTTPVGLPGPPPTPNRVSTVLATPLSSTFTGGFVTILGPTAAGATVTGQVMDANGLPIRNAIVTLAASSGETQSVSSNSFGYYRFEGVSTGQAYLLSARAKGYTFVPRTVNVKDNVVGINLFAEPR